MKKLFQSYESEKKKATSQIVKRQSRGNVLVQDGWFLTLRGLAKLSRSAAQSVTYLEKKYG